MNINVYKNGISFEFKTTYEKDQLPIYYNNKDGTCIMGNIKYDQITNYSNNENLFELFIDYNVDIEIFNLIIKGLTYHTCICDLFINNQNELCIFKYSNNIHKYIEKILSFDIIDIVKFGDKISAIKNDFTKSHKIKIIEYLGNYSYNIDMLPDNLDLIKYKYNSAKVNIVKKTKNTKKVIMKDNKSYITHNIKNIVGYDKILLVNNNKIKFNLCEINPDCILLWSPNDCVDLTNLPWSVKKISLYDDFSANLDFLPDTLNCIEFCGKINSSLWNLPSSINLVIFDCFDWENFCDKITELNVEHIILNNYNSNDINENIVSLTFPKKLKLLEINSSNYKNNLNNLTKIIQYNKEKNNLNFKFDIIDF